MAAINCLRCRLEAYSREEDECGLWVKVVRRWGWKPGVSVRNGSGVSRVRVLGGVTEGYFWVNIVL